MMLGSGYRDLWGTPISVEVLDLRKEAGGLTPVRRVGGQQTKGLAFQGADGRSYTFRGLEKDASHLLDAVDPDLKDSAIADLLNDLMSAQHPASELVARGLLDATGIPCPPWRLVTLPDDPALGQFQKDFAGAVGVFAEYPRAPRARCRASSAPPRSSTTWSSTGGWRRERPTRDTRALLRARLVDIFMGDWDRHRKQWRWAHAAGEPALDADPGGPRPGLLALRRVRAQPGARNGPPLPGFRPQVRRDRRPHLQRLGAGPAPPRRLLARGLRRGRRRPLQAQLTDAAIEKAAKQMPPEWYRDRRRPPRGRPQGAPRRPR